MRPIDDTTFAITDFTRRYYLPARPYGYALFRLYFRLCAVGVEHIPTSGPVVLVPNHSSFMDPPLLSAVVPRVIYFLMLHHHFYHPRFHWLFSRLPCIPVKRSGASMSAMKACLDVLEHDHMLCVFPEGGISEEHKAKGLRTGAAVMAMKTRAPIVPVALHGVSSALPLGKIFPRPRPITITFGEPIAPPDGDARDKDLLQRLTEDVMAHIHDLLREAENPVGRNPAGKAKR